MVAPCICSCKPTERAATEASGATTRAPPRLPRRTLMSVSASRMRNASRRVGRDTPYCSMSWLSAGRVSPGRSSPRTICRRRWLAISSPVLGARTTVPIWAVEPLTMVTPQSYLHYIKRTNSSDLLCRRVKTLSGSLGGKAQRAVEADRLAVEVGILGDLLGQLSVLTCAAHPLGERD